MSFTAFAIVLGVSISAAVFANLLNRGFIKTRREAQRAIRKKLRQRDRDCAGVASWARSGDDEKGRRIETLTRLLARMLEISDSRVITSAETVGALLLAPLSEVHNPPSRCRIDLNGDQFIDGFSDEFLELLKENVAPENWPKLAETLACDVRDEDALLQRLYSLRMSDAIPLLAGYLK